MKNFFGKLCGCTTVKCEPFTQVVEKVKVFKKVSWNDDVSVHVYYLEEGETLGRMKVSKGKHVKVAIPDDHKDLIQTVCGVDATCNVYVAPKRVEKAQDAELLAALGML
jgi:hypothetical protein